MVNDTIKRLRFTGKREIEFVDDACPDKLDSGDVLIRVEACGICGSDLLMYTGSWKQPSVTPGHELAGTVMKIGPGVTSVAVEERVTAAPMLACGACPECRAGTPRLCTQSEFVTAQRDGAMATHAILPDYTLHRLSDDIQSNEAVLVEPLAVAVHCFRRFGDIKGMKIGIVGAGTLGLMCVHTAKSMGAAEVICVARHSFQAKLAESLGADTVVTETPKDSYDSLDIAFDCVGGRGEAFRQTLQLVTRKGSIIAVGGYHGLAGIDMGTLVRKEITVIGSFCYSEKDGRHDMNIAADMALASRAKLQPLITHTFPLQEAKKAFDTALDKKKNKAIKVVLVI